MTTRVNSYLGPLQIRTSGPDLWLLAFERIETTEPIDPTPGSKIKTELVLNLLSVHKQHLMVELKASAVAEWARVAAAYRVAFVLAGTPSDDERKAALRMLGSNVGPQMLLPFLREAIAGTTQKSGMPPLSLPLVDLSEFEDMEIPESENDPPPDVRAMAEEGAEGSGT